MRIVYLSHINNYHTIKWARYFSEHGNDVHVLSLQKPDPDILSGLSNISVHWLGFSGNVGGSSTKKISYLFTLRQIRHYLDKLDPDVIHAHYASSYGFLASLCCDKPYYLSVWGSDVYDFPNRGPIHKLALTHALKKCTWLCSTSKAMAQEANKYVNKPVLITPFGVDTKLFNPCKRVRRDSGRIILGTVKALEKKYGIDILLNAVARIHDRRPDLDLRLRIAGKGSLEDELKIAADTLGIAGITEWLGFIPQDDAAREWASFDIGIVASVAESFGVSAVECQASGTPLVISDIPGLMEAANNGATAVVVPRCNPNALADAIELLIDSPSLRAKLSREGRSYVCRSLNLDDCFGYVENLYHDNL